METDKYNGWTNYETWVFKLWIDNEQSCQEYWAEQAKETWNCSKACKHLTKKECAVYNLKNQLKETFEELIPDLGASPWADLLNASFSLINWYEIAEAILDDSNIIPTENNHEAKE